MNSSPALAAGTDSPLGGIPLGRHICRGREVLSLGSGRCGANYRNRLDHYAVAGGIGTMIDTQGSDWDTAGEDAELYDSFGNVRQAKKAFSIPTAHKDLRADGRLAFGETPMDLLRASSVPNGLKVLYAYCDKVQGNGTWSPTGYRHTAVELNWAPTTVKRMAELGELYGVFRIRDRVAPNGNGQPEKVIEIIHAPHRGMWNPDVKLPPNKVVKSLATPLPERLRDRAVANDDNEGLLPMTSRAVANDDSSCCLSDTAPRSIRSERSIEGEGSVALASQPLKGSNPVASEREISAEESKRLKTSSRISKTWRRRSSAKRSTN